MLDNNVRDFGLKCGREPVYLVGDLEYLLDFTRVEHERNE